MNKAHQHVVHILHQFHPYLISLEVEHGTFKSDPGLQVIESKKFPPGQQDVLETYAGFRKTDVGAASEKATAVNI